MQDEINSYLEGLTSSKMDWIVELEENARLNNIPIMESVSIDFMLKHIRAYQPKRILEIGTAIGYSALRMLEASPEAEMITIEKDEERYQEALENIQKQQKTNQIDVILGDALEVLPTLQNEKKEFDFIFIDAAKGKYREFFDLIHPLVTKNGWLITDNVLFRGYVANPEETPKRYKTMVRKLIAYNKFLHTHPDYITSILPIGDGVMMSYKKDSC